MQRRQFLKTGATGVAALTVEPASYSEILSAGAAPSGPVGSAGPLAPVADFPYRVRQTYFNSAALGLSPRPVRERMHTFVDGLLSEGTGYYFRNRAEINELPRTGAARLYGTRPENIALTHSISEVVSQFAWWLRPRRGQNVVSIDIECPSTTLPWMRVAKETGADVRLVSVWSDPGSLTFEKLATLVDKNTAAISICQVQWVTGFRLDLKAVADLAHENNALLIVDAMHSAGVVPIDVHRDDVDVLVAGGYKWIGGTTGTAACYVRRELMARVEPILAGADTPRPAPPFDDVESRVLKWPEGPTRLEYSSQGHSSKVSFGAGAHYLADLGLDRVEAHTHRLGAMLADGLRRVGATVVTPDDPNKRAGIITARFKRNGVELAAALEKEGIFVSPRKGMIRFALHVYNDEEGVDRTLSVLKTLV